jgi:uncharacterized protein
MLRRWVELVVKHPWITIAIIFALTGTILVHAGQLQLRLEPDAQIPPDHPLVKVGQMIQKEFGGKYIGAIIIYPKHGTIYTKKVFQKIKAITDRANNLPGLRPNGVVSLVSENLRDIQGSGGMLKVEPYVSDIPATEEEFAELRKRLQNNYDITRGFVNKDGTATTIVIDFNDFDAAGGSKNCQPALEKIVAPERDAETDITVTSMPAMVYWFLIYSQRATIVFILTVIVIAWLQFRAFRTFQGMLIPLVTALLGVGWAMGMMGWVKADIDPWNSIIPILVLAIAAGHSTQILKRYYEEYNRIRREKPDLTPKACNREAVIEATTRVGSVMLAAGGIAAISFGSLITFEMPSVQSFGKGVAFGILASLLIEMTFIPALRSVLPAPTEKQAAKEKSRAFFDPILYWLADRIRTGRDGWIIAVSLGLFVLGLAGAFRMQVNNSMDAQFFPGTDLWRRFEPGPDKEGSFLDGVHLAAKKTVGAYGLFIRFETPKPEGIKDPDVLRRIERIENFIKARTNEFSVGAVISVVDFIKIMNRAMNDDDPKQAVIPATHDAVAQYLLLYTMSGPGGDIERFVDFDYQRSLMRVYLKTDDSQNIVRLIELVRAEIKEAFKGSKTIAEVGGGTAYMIALNETIVRDKILNMIQLASIIFVVTTLFLRSFVGAFLVLVPLLSSVVINFGIMGWFNIWLSMGTATISAIAVGIGADYAIYFIFRTREEYHRTGNKREAAAVTLTTSGKAIASVATAIAAGFLCVPFTGSKLHFLMGLLVALMMVSSCLGAVALMPAILVRIKASFLDRGMPKEN